MIVSSILGAAALMAVHADPARAPRDAYTSCLFTFVDKAVDDRTGKSDFETRFPQQCRQQEQSFRAALRSARMTADDAEMEVKDAQENARARFQEAQQPS